ncbi:hypothetical protein D9Q98_009165 [Chlorella vulgaris]|uniref:Uncharacterized protein n=1 Tax=Chlorella vulgaris TaxID=3077 RepID=A0A9D4YX51_CHLVU|nr:hypothetical protein D9Q98_009165 [Chlorella vulgaris]
MQPSLVLWAAAESRVPPKPSTSGSAPGGAAHKPYTVPPGYKAPTLGEQFRYAALRHPYSRYGYVAAVAMGLLGWAVASGEKKPGRQLDGGGTVESSSSKT